MASLITKEAILNEFSYVKENFFQQLLEKALENEIITIEETVKYRDGMAGVIMEHAYDVTSEVEFMIKKTCEVVIKNHFYILSLYLSTFKPAEALLKVQNTSSFKLHTEAVKYFERTLSDEWFKLKDFENVVNTSKELRLLKGTYNSILNQFKIFLNYDNNFADLTQPIVIPEYSFMSSSQLCSKDLIYSLSMLSKSFMIEVNMRNKFDKKTIHEIKRRYSDMNKTFNKMKIEADVRMKEAELKKSIRSKIESKYADMAKDDPNFEFIFGNTKEKEYESELELAMESIEQEKDASIDEVDTMYELDNMLVSTLVELACVLINLEFPKFKNPDSMPKKYKALNRVPKEILFDVLFSHEEIVKFSDVEKEYLQEYFIQNLVTIE